MSIRTVIKNLLPPIITSLIQNKKRKSIYGDFSTWNEAEKAGGKYAPNMEVLVERYKLYRANKPRVYNKYPTNEIWAWCTLSGLQLAARENDNCLKVLDFGGSLGSTYFQLRDYLSSIATLKWCVVEQEPCANAGKLHFEDDKLKFFDSLDVATEKTNFNVLLLGGVLQYLSSPYDTLSLLLKSDFEFVFLDRTPLFPSFDEKIMLQETATILGGSLHPIRILSEEKLMSIFNESYTLLGQQNYGPHPHKNSISNYKCLLFRKN
jgi:putative methyltransferase (TIGR04325 family)